MLDFCFQMYFLGEKWIYSQKAKPWAISVYWDHCLVPPGHQKQQQSRLVWASNCECWRVCGLGAILIHFNSYFFTTGMETDLPETLGTRTLGVVQNDVSPLMFCLRHHTMFGMEVFQLSARMSGHVECRADVNISTVGIVLRPWCWGFHSSGQICQDTDIHRHPQTLNSDLDRSASLVFDTVNRVVGVEPLLFGLLGREGSEHQKSHCIYTLL